MKTVFTLLFTVVLSLPLQAQSLSNDTYKISRLENQVSMLQETVKKLSDENEQIKQALEKLTGQKIDVAQNCDVRTARLEEKRTELMKLGFTESHPDVANINKTLAKECRP